jgi:ribose transport system substrate-binding protein
MELIGVASNLTRKHLAVTFGVVALVLGVIAGPATATSSKNPLAVPRANLAKYMGATVLTKPGPAFNAAKAAAQGDTAYIAAYLAANPAIGEADGGYMTAMESMGITPTLCDGGGSSVGDNTCFTQAFSASASVILAQGSSPTTYTSILSTAKQSGTPVIEGMDTDPTGAKLFPGVTANAGPPWKLVGRLMADYILKDANKKPIHVLLENIPDVDGALQEQAAFRAEMHKYAPKATLTTFGVTVANWATGVGPATASALLANPSINYVVPEFDPMVIFASAAMQQAGTPTSVKIVTSGGSYLEMSQLTAGTNYIAAEVGIDYPALGMLEADQTLRAMVGATQVPDYTPPVKVFDKSNIARVAVTAARAASGAFYANITTYAAMFTKAWHNGK